MSPRAVVVVHREAMIAEGLAAALARYPAIVPIAVATSASDAERSGERADVVALDARIPGAKQATDRLRRRGVRVVLLGDVQTTEDGICVSTRGSVASLASALVPGAYLPPQRPRLTARQQQVLSLAARGFSAKQVATRLGISPKTVERHKTRIFERLGVPNQAAAVSVVAAIGNGMEGSWIRSST